jgi:hypothetical protein
MPKYNVSEPQSGALAGTVVQPCAGSGLLCVVLNYELGPDIPRVVTLRIVDVSGSQPARVVAGITMSMVTLPVPAGRYTVEVVSAQWRPPINLIYQAVTQLGHYTSVVIPLRAEIPQVSKLIHFVWAGGRKLMPPDNITAVKAWAAAHTAERFAVYIWIDEQFMPGTRDRYREFGLPSAVIQLKDITQEGVSSPHVRYEIDRFRPNYGASSDMLRYNILARFGGAYFDSDVNPGVVTLNHDGLFDRMSSGLFLVDNNSQGKGLIGNDAFICTAGNEIMRAIAAAAEENYRRPYPEMGNRVYNYDKPTYMTNSTIVKTGPMAVAEVLCERGRLRDLANPRVRGPRGEVLQVTTKAIGGRAVLTQVRDEHWMDSGYVRPEAQNQGNWMKVPIKSVASLQEAISIAVGTARFEAKYMRLIRLDDHVRDIAESLKRKFSEKGEPSGEEYEIASQFAEALENAGLELGDGISGPFLSRYSPLRRFCYTKLLIGIEDNRPIQHTRPIGATTGPRAVPGSLELLWEKADGMDTINTVQMGIQFLENGIARAAREIAALKLLAVPPAAAVEESVALCEALQSVLLRLHKLFAENRDRFNPRVEEDGFGEQLVLYRLGEVMAKLAPHAANPGTPGPALSPTWMADVNSRRLYPT